MTAGLPADKVLDELREMRAGDLPTHGGRTLAYVYDSGLSGVDELAAAAHALASSANGLDPTAFPSLMRMENEVVATADDAVAGLSAAERASVFTGTATQFYRLTR